MEHTLLLKIQNQNILPKGGGGDQPSLDSVSALLHDQGEGKYT